MNNIRQEFPRFILLSLLSLLCVAAQSQDIGTAEPETMKKLYPGETYSPYAQRSFPSQVYWGEMHLHTSVSLDAGLFGNTLGHEEAYRFARGEEVISSTGLPVKLSRPLDWLCITDHSDAMGFASDMQRGAPNIANHPKGSQWYQGFKQGGQAAAEAAFDLITNFAQGTLPQDLMSDYNPGATAYDRVWDDIVETAEEFNDPGTFTTIIGFEWTSVPQGMNMHRNVLLRDNGDRAGQVVPMTTKAFLGSDDVLDLYQWMSDYEEKTGGTALALAHNGNLSNGWMFPMEETYHGGKVDEAYVRKRARWEPLYEVTQIKGDGEAHPFLSSTDEFANYETWDVGNLDLTELKKDEMLAGEYAREALKNGLVLEKKLGTNPYKFGMAGATDSHTSLTTAEEENFYGKSASVEPSVHRVEHPFVKSKLGEWSGHKLVASGYTGVWATENTRKAIFDALARKEVYATTGPRMMVRLFGGWDFTEEDIQNRNPAFTGYAKGVPMGGDLTNAPRGKSPSFMVYALRDPIGANLDRIQIIKGWLDKRGNTQEKIYDVAVSDGRTIGDDGRCKTPVGNTVNYETASWTNTIGDPELIAVWTDPDFDADESAFYYVRVMEIPTPRWLLYDKVRLGANVPEEAELDGQERAYSSPIWYTPAK